jgi:DivIVA domain-containing protein
MNDNSDLLPNLVHEDAFEMQMRGYSRRQVDEFIARCRSQIRDLEQRLARALDDGEELKRDLATARQQALGAKPAHEEVSERIAQILKLADDEAKSQKSKAHEDIARQRNEAQQEADKVRAEAREQAERMLTAAQEQAERAITSARAEADKTVNAARAEADSTTSDAKKKSEAVLAGAKAQAKKALDEATARATAIHDGAERRLNLLSTRHSETIKRLTEILDGVSSLVTAESARLSLEDEVDQATAKAIGAAEPAGGPRSAAPATGPNGPAGPRPSAPAGTVSGRTAPSPQAQGPQPSADKRPQSRTGVIEPGEQTEGVRVMPGSDS